MKKKLEKHLDDEEPQTPKTRFSRSINHIYLKGTPFESILGEDRKTIHDKRGIQYFEQGHLSS